MAWVLTVDVPLQIGTIILQGDIWVSYLLPIMNFYHGEVVQNKFWFSYSDPDYVPPSSNKSNKIENVEQLEMQGVDLVLSRACSGVPC
ncbi:hypothetical protein [Spiroplasma poulsonii]|uniref:hypothetical protein n=1 Tax=Spiroplasma poulsonii TaxID=2138 RepID=UPI001F4D1523|nr:hypothetical protein [Spiroplasma poulsonii]UNF61913.1 hypothetical protein MNU24_00125 [Spiroplasma poulsonii]